MIRCSKFKDGFLISIQMSKKTVLKQVRFCPEFSLTDPFKN